MQRTLFHLLLLAGSILLGGCATGPSTIPYDRAARVALEEAIRNEPVGNYFIGRRYFKNDYKFWGYVREPRKPWTTAKLVMLNEQRKYAPDRAAWKIGSDHNYEYKLKGYFSGETVYEPASNKIYPEFVLQDIELLSTNPGPIFRTRDGLNPARRVIEQPY
jgi:hypothetical protein